MALETRRRTTPTELRLHGFAVWLKEADGKQKRTRERDGISSTSAKGVENVCEHRPLGRGFGSDGKVQPPFADSAGLSFLASSVRERGAEPLSFQPSDSHGLCVGNGSVWRKQLLDCWWSPGPRRQAGLGSVHARVPSGGGHGFHILTLFGLPSPAHEGTKLTTITAHSG